MYVQDDQQLFVRYMLQNPHVISIDYDRSIFMTSYKEMVPDFMLSFRLGLVVAGDDHVALLHCNSKASNFVHLQ